MTLSIHWFDSFGTTELKEMMHEMFPGIEDGREDELPHEHPMTAVGVVLLVAALKGTLEIHKLKAHTGYSANFLSAISLNMRNNGLWVENRYATDWLSQDGWIDDEKLWDHVEIACGNLWLTAEDRPTSEDPCDIFWDERDLGSSLWVR